MNVSNSVIYQEQHSSMLQEQIFYVGMYVRLSREDEEKQEESQSIEHQRDFLLDYVQTHENWILVDIYKDDGFTRT